MVERVMYRSWRPHAGGSYEAVRGTAASNNTGFSVAGTFNPQGKMHQKVTEQGRIENAGVQKRQQRERSRSFNANFLIVRSRPYVSFKA
jgi:hypothetical protein